MSTTGTPATQAVSGFGNKHNFTDADYAQMTKDLKNLAQDANGEHTYDNQKATLGHIEAKYFLVVDRNTHDVAMKGVEIKVDLEKLGEKGGVEHYLPNGSEYDAHRKAYEYVNIDHGDGAAEVAARRLRVMRLTALNYGHLRLGGMDSKHAFFIAGLRARWMITGALGVLLKDKGVNHEEVLIAEPNDKIFGKIVNAPNERDVVEALGKFAREFVTEVNSAAHGIIYIALHSEHFWLAAEHCFRVRNHHFKNSKEFLKSYEELYERYLKAAYEGEFKWPDGIDFYEVFRLGIHPFKIKCLPVMAAHYIAHHKVSNSSIVRMSGSPCGCASITTAVAALDTMRAEPWWQSFNNAYKDTIDCAVSFANQINGNKYAFHISASLYGMPKASKLKYDGQEYTIDEAKARVSMISAACQGMIIALRNAVKQNLISKFALQNAMALEKPAASNPMLSLRISELVGAAINVVANAETMKDAIEAALPVIASGTTSATTVATVN